MAGSNSPGQQIDQIRFGFGDPNDLAVKGFGPMGHTLAGKPELSAWTERLHLHYRSADSKTTPRPPVSQVYWSDGEHAAVLRRIRSTASDNRDDWCHALVGPASVLTVRHALCMDEEWWSKLRDQDPQGRRPLELHAWSRQSASAKRLAARGQGLTGQLIAVAAAALPDPRRPISIITQDMDIDDKRALLWALLDLTGTDDKVPWTFSTYETQHEDGANRPQVLFLAEVPPQQSYGHSRVTVNLSSPTGNGTYETAAREWVDQYRRAGHDGARAWRARYQPPAAILGIAPSTETQQSLPSPRHSDTQPPASPPFQAPPPRTPTQSDPLPAGPSAAPPKEPSPGQAAFQEPPLPDPSVGVPPGWEQQLTDPASQMPSGKAAPMEPSQEWTKLPPSRLAPERPHIIGRPAGPASTALGLVNQLGKTRESGHAQQILDRIKIMEIPGDPADRRKIRDRLYETHFWVQQLEDVFNVEHQPYAQDEVRSAVRVLIRFALPVADLKNPILVDKANRFVASPRNHSLVAAELVLHFAQQGVPHALDAGCAARWKRQAGLPAPHPSHSVAANDVSIQRNRWQFATYILAACLAALALIQVVQLTRHNDGPIGRALVAPSTSRSTTSPSSKASTTPSANSAYPGYRPLYDPTSLTVKTSDCHKHVYIDVGGPPNVSYSTDALDITYTEDCGNGSKNPRPVSLTGGADLEVSKPANGANSHPCLSHPGPVQNYQPSRNDLLCIKTHDLLVELTVLRVDKDGQLAISVAGWIK